MATATPSVQRISVEELNERLERGESLVLVDVREAFERAIATIPVTPNAVECHCPMGDAPGRIDELRAAAATGPLIVYCHLGVRSRAFANWLARQGVDGVVDVDGGIDAWSIRVDPSVPRY